MKIVVFVKQCPDSNADIHVVNGQIHIRDVPLAINPWDEIAVEAALIMKEGLDAEVIAVSIGKEDETEALKHALAMGCTDALLISDPELENVDTQVKARVMAAVVKKIGSVGAALFGRRSIDNGSAMTPVQTARLLHWPSLTQVSEINSIDKQAGKVTVTRTIEEGQQILEAHLPVMISVGKDFAEPRYPSFIGKRKAAKTLIPVWSLKDIGIKPTATRIDRIEVKDSKQKEIETQMISGRNAAEIAKELIERLIAEKVL